MGTSPWWGFNITEDAYHWGDCAPTNPYAFAVGFAPGAPVLNLLNMSLEGHDAYSMVMLSWECILFSDLKTQGPGSVYYFQDWKRKDPEVYTMFGPQN